MQKILSLYKPPGITPYQLIQQFRKDYPEYKERKIGYAGRLDPLAHGVMLLMIGEATKEKDTYLNLPKEYEFEIVFGLETDTYDVLGVLQDTYVIARNEERMTKQSPKASKKVRGLPRSLSVARNDVATFIQSKLGKQIQFYPPYSSKTVAGKPLYWWARQNKLSEITIPTREIEIFSFALLSLGTINKQLLQTKIMEAIQGVTGDFRQEMIQKRWGEFFATTKVTSFSTARCKISCSSGTYVRGLTHELGEQLGTGAITLEILRTKVGEYLIADSLCNANF